MEPSFPPFEAEECDFALRLQTMLKRSIMIWLEWGVAGSCSRCAYVIQQPNEDDRGQNECSQCKSIKSVFACPKIVSFSHRQQLQLKSNSTLTVRILYWKEVCDYNWGNPLLWNGDSDLADLRTSHLVLANDECRRLVMRWLTVNRCDLSFPSIFSLQEIE